jgi:SHS2 domain-containing protein
MFVFTQTFKSTKDVRHLVVDQSSDEDACAYAEALLDSSVDTTSVRVFKEMAFVRKVESKVWS